MKNAIKDILGPMFEVMLKGEMNHYLGYESNSKGVKESSNRRNGYGKKSVRTSIGDEEIATPRDRDGKFEPQLISKRQKDVSVRYAKGMSQQDLSSTVEDIYVFSIFHDMLSNITDSVIPELED